MGILLCRREELVRDPPRMPKAGNPTNLRLLPLRRRTLREKKRVRRRLVPAPWRMLRELTLVEVVMQRLRHRLIHKLCARLSSRLSPTPQWCGSWQRPSLTPPRLLRQLQLQLMRVRAINCVSAVSGRIVRLWREPFIGYLLSCRGGVPAR